MEHKVIKTLAATTLATGSILASVAIANNLSNYSLETLPDKVIDFNETDDPKLKKSIRNDMAKQTITYWVSCACIGTAIGKLGNYMISKLLTENDKGIKE